MSDVDPLAPAERLRFLAALPWWLNGSLATTQPAEQAWMDETRRRSRWAAQQAEREQALAGSLAAPLPADASLGLATLLQRVRAEAPAPAAEPGAAAPPWWAGWFAGPRVALVLAGLVIVQAGLLGWFAATREPAAAMRSGPVTELRTLRVTFVPETTEAQLRTLLLRAGARVVGGPNQLGEYWLASDIRSLDEMRQVLQGSGRVRTLEVDVAGPPHAR